MFDIDSHDADRDGARRCATGELPTGRKIAGRASFFIGAADAPIDPPPGWQPTKLAAKIAAGAKFAQTQFCMDAGDHAPLRRAACCERGHAAIFISSSAIAPLRSAKSARWMKEHLWGTIIPDEFLTRLDAAADPGAEGQRICIELIEDFARIPGVAGVHIMAPANEAGSARR